MMANRFTSNTPLPRKGQCDIFKKLGCDGEEDFRGIAGLLNAWVNNSCNAKLFPCLCNYRIVTSIGNAIKETDGRKKGAADE